METAGMVLLSGPQQMSAYLDDPERSAKALLEHGGIRWYVTGDQGRLDEDGYLTLIDRYARFAKLGGEMVSLTMVEQALTSVIGDAGDTPLAVVAINDVAKGEKLVALCQGEVDQAILRARWRELGHATLMWPAVFLSVEQLPMLGTGKADYQGAKRLVLSLLEASSSK